MVRGVCVCVCKGGCAVLRMIMGVNKISLIFIDPVRYEDLRCCIVPVCRIFAALLTSVTELLTINLFLPSVEKEAYFFFSLVFARKKRGVRAR